MTPSDGTAGPDGDLEPLDLLGVIGPIDVGVARAHVEEEAAGDVAAMTRLGDLAALEGDRVSERLWHERASELGDAGAMNNLGLLARLDGDHTDSERWHQQALETGGPEAMFGIAYRYTRAGDAKAATSRMRQRGTPALPSSEAATRWRTCATSPTSRWTRRHAAGQPQLHQAPSR